jgi:uncharacterized protein YecE (DUF72 family)
MDVRPLDLGPLPGADDDLRRARDNKPDVPLHPLRSASFTLIRYIGHPDVARNDPLLDEWAARLRAWIAEGTTVFFFHALSRRTRVAAPLSRAATPS